MIMLAPENQKVKFRQWLRNIGNVKAVGLGVLAIAGALTINRLFLADAFLSISQIEGNCQMDAVKATRVSGGENAVAGAGIAMILIKEYVEGCMKSKGYELNSDRQWRKKSESKERIWEPMQAK